MSPLVLSDSSSSTGAGCYGTDVAEASSVRLPPDCSAPRSSGESSPGRGSSIVSSVLAGPSMVCGPCEHWTHTSTELLCGGNRTNSLYATVLIRRVILPTSRTSVDG